MQSIASSAVWPWFLSHSAKRAASVAVMPVSSIIWDAPPCPVSILTVMVSYRTIILTYQTGKSIDILIICKIFYRVSFVCGQKCCEPLDALWNWRFFQGKRINGLSEIRPRRFCQTRFQKFGYFENWFFLRSCSAGLPRSDRHKRKKSRPRTIPRTGYTHIYYYLLVSNRYGTVRYGMVNRWISMWQSIGQSHGQTTFQAIKQAIGIFQATKQAIPTLTKQASRRKPHFASLYCEPLDAPESGFYFW